MLPPNTEEGRGLETALFVLVVFLHVVIFVVVISILQVLHLFVVFVILYLEPVISWNRRFRVSAETENLLYSASFLETGTPLFLHFVFFFRIPVRFYS